jgi:hypothetical protein
MTMVLDAFPDEFDANITIRMYERFQNTAMGTVMPHELYARQEDTDNYQEVMDQYSTFGEAVSWADGADVTLDAAEKEYDWTVKQEGWGLGFAVSRHMVRYDKRRTVENWADALADSFIALLRNKHAYILNNAFVGVTYGDGKVLCATDHPTAGGGSRSNVLAVATALSWDSFDDVRILGVQHTDYRGKAMPRHFNQIIVPEQLSMTAKQIIGSPQEPFTTDNQINPVMQLGYGLVTEDRLTSTTAWFLQEQGQHGIVTFTGYPVTFKSYFEQRSESLVHYGESDFKCTVLHWAGIAGTAGA